MRETSVPKTFILSPSKQGSKNFQVKINFLHFYILLYYHIYTYCLHKLTLLSLLSEIYLKMVHSKHYKYLLTCKTIYYIFKNIWCVMEITGYI